MSQRVDHEMILASAGSGKTYALVNRYLRLLALGVNPTRIIALTFTRKAAGEFLQKIFLRLKGAAGDSAESAQGQGQNHPGVREQTGAGGLVAGEIIHGQLDDAWNEELQQIDYQKRANADGEYAQIAPEIGK